MKPRTTKTAWETALKLLGGRDYSRPEMEAKLAQRGFEGAEVADALAKLEHYGYTVATGADAGRMEQMAAQYLAKKKDPSSAGAIRSLEAFLLRKGFEPEMVAAHLEQLAAVDVRHMECVAASPLFRGAARRADCHGSRIREEDIDCTT